MLERVCVAGAERRAPEDDRERAGEAAARVALTQVTAALTLGRPERVKNI